jgi:hypothetical protein
MPGFFLCMFIFRFENSFGCRVQLFLAEFHSLYFFFQHYPIKVMTGNNDFLSYWYDDMRQPHILRAAKTIVQNHNFTLCMCVILLEIGQFERTDHRKAKATKNRKNHKEHFCARTIPYERMKQSRRCFVQFGISGPV